jgi:hypothetical protein
MLNLPGVKSIRIDAVKRHGRQSSSASLDENIPPRRAGVNGESSLENGRIKPPRMGRIRLERMTSSL